MESLDERCIRRLEKEVSRLNKSIKGIKDQTTLEGTKLKLEEYSHILKVFISSRKHL